MKIKWLGTGCNKRQLRSLLREEIAKREKAEIERDAANLLAKENKSKHNVANELLNETKDKLIERTGAAQKAIELNISLAEEVAQLTQTNESFSKEIVSLKDKLKLEELTVNCREEEIDKLKLQIGSLQQTIKEMDRELALANRPFLKKFFRVE